MKKLFIALLLLLSSNVLYAQGRGVPSNMKNKIWNAMQEDMRKRQQKQERQHESTVRNAQAAQRSDRQIRETREDAAFLNDYYQPDNYISGPNYDDMSDFSSAHRNTNNSERMSMLENDGEEPSSSVDLIDASSLKQPGSSSSIVIDPDKPFSFRQESQWTEALEEEYGQKWIVPYDEMEQKGIVYTAMDADVWDGFKSSLGERQRDMLVINLMQLNDGVLPKFVCYGDKGEYIMENKNGEKYIISADGGSIDHVSDEENSIIENWKKMWDEKKFYKGDYGWKGSKGEAYLKVTLANGQTEHERNWIGVGEVLTVSGGGSLAYGLKVAAKGSGKIELPSISKVYDKLQVKYPDKPKKDKSDDGIKSNLLLGKVEAEGKATLAEVGVGLGAGFTVKAFDKYFVVKAHGSVKGEVGIGASWSAKGEVMSGNKILSGKVSPEIVYGLGGKITVAPEIYVYDVAELHQKIPSRL